jgi:hypothetical protein
VQDGYWEKIDRGTTVSIRPVPGYEDYDRVVAVTSAFVGGRRIETDVFFHRATNKNRPFGFGLLPLWGGRPDDPNHLPRRGWNFSIAWYYSHYKGVGIEFSYKYGPNAPDWLSTYTNYTIEPNTLYHIVSETWPEVDSSGNHLRYKQRMKWWSNGDPEPATWLELVDSAGCPLQPEPYAIAIVAHRCQVEFGPLKIRPITTVNTLKIN